MKLKSIFLFASGILMFSSAFSQLHVSTASSAGVNKKYVLLEEGTGCWCGYCPDGAEDIERNIEPNYPRAIIASFHNSDPMALTADDFNTDYIASSVGWPGATVDRNLFSGSVGQSRPWDNFVKTDTGLVAKFQVDMKSTYDPASKLLTVTVTGKSIVSLTGTWNVNAYIIEDSISSAGANGQGNYAHCGCSHDYTTFGAPPYDTSWFWHDGNGLAETAIPVGHYSHMNVVRKLLATGAGAGGKALYGDTLFTNPAAGTTKSKTYTFTVPATYNANNLKVIGLVQKYGTTINDRAIENAIEAKLRLMPANTLGVTPVSNVMMDVQIFPNPAKNFITVKGMLENPTDTRIVIYNALGQVMTDKVYSAGGSLFGENISLTGFSNGNYFMNITNNGETVTKQFSVNK